MVMGPKDVYLISYNLACCLGWAAVWILAVRSFTNKVISGRTVTESLAELYSTPGLEWVLMSTQIAAVLEIVHAYLKFVRSTVSINFRQVGTRITSIVAIALSQKAQASFATGIMILSWATVEVPRYLFYLFGLITGDANKTMPFPLLWLRYSLFYVLYPTGILSELVVFYYAVQDQSFLDAFLVFTPLVRFYYSAVVPILYLFGTPFMISYQIKNRRAAFAKRFEKPSPPPRGLCWPIDKKTGDRSSTDTNKAILAAAVGAVNTEKATSLLRCKGWRFQYVRHLAALVQEQCASPQAALQVAQAGLDKAYELFEFIAPDGSCMSLQQAMSVPNSEKFYTGFIQGQGNNNKVTELEVPYQGQLLKGKALKDKVQEWIDYGTIEPSAGTAIIQCVDHPEYLEIFAKRYYVLLGAGSAMGPYSVLLSLGANVVAIDLDRPQIWQKLIDIAKSSPGTVTFPLKVDPASCPTEAEMCQHAGCNLFTHTPMIRDWLLSLYPGKGLTIGNYAYLDGALHVQVSLAMDAICRDVSERRADTSLVYLCTPTDLHLIPREAHVAAEGNFQSYRHRFFCTMMQVLSGGKYLRKNVNPPVTSKGGEDFYYVNGISVAQGPNYALAKRMQHWRAIIARSKGCTVSSNIAPSTSTVSVVHNRTFAWAYEGMPYFKPFEIFAPETSKAVMSAILAYDLNDPKSVANPSTILSNPNQLFSYGAFHGGVWRCAYEVDSIGVSSVIIYFSRLARPYALAAGAIGVAAAAIYLGRS